MERNLAMRQGKFAIESIFWRRVIDWSVDHIPSIFHRLAFVSGTPIYPLFIVRSGRQKYKIIACEPMICPRLGASRDQIIAAAMQRWSNVLKEAVRTCWPQWFAFTRLV